MRPLIRASVLVLGICWSLPILWILLCSFNRDLLGGVPNPEDIAFTTAHFRVLRENDLYSAIVNSIWVAFGGAALGTVVALLMAFGLLCRREPMSRSLLAIISGRTIPPIAFLLPQYLFFKSLGLGSSRGALLLVDSVAASSLCLVFISPFVLRLHNAFFDQTRVDGATSLAYLHRILLPQLQRPMLFGFAAAFMLSWSDFLFAGVFVVTNDNRTLPVLISSFLTSYGTAWGPMYAAVSVSLFAAMALIGVFAAGVNWYGKLAHK